MKVNVSITKQQFSAHGIYEDGHLTVLCGSSINPIFAPYLKSDFIKTIRKDTAIVENNVLIKDYTFSSPSSAAQFVMGQSRDGYDAWKMSDGISLGNYLSKQGIRERRKKEK